MDKKINNPNRQYFRLPLQVAVFYRSVNEDGSLDPEEEFIEGVTLDISGGGMRIKSSGRLTPGRRLQCLIKIGDDLLPVSARVARERVLEHPGQYEVGIAFEEISESVRTRIIRYIFSEQRKFTFHEPEI